MSLESILSLPPEWNDFTQSFAVVYWKTVDVCFPREAFGSPNCIANAAGR